MGYLGPLIRNLALFHRGVYRPSDCFIINSIRVAGEPKKYCKYATKLIENKILNAEMKNMKNSFPESSEMTIFGNGQCQKEFMFHLGTGQY